MSRNYTAQNVFEAALDRIRWVYRECDDVIVSMSGGKDSAVTFELAKLVAAEGPSAPQMLLAGSGGRMAGNRGLHAGRHACPGGQAVLVPDSLPAEQLSFFATSAMFILSLCHAAK